MQVEVRDEDYAHRRNGMSYRVSPNGVQNVRRLVTLHAPGTKVQWFADEVAEVETC